MSAFDMDRYELGSYEPPHVQKQREAIESLRDAALKDNAERFQRFVGTPLEFEKIQAFRQRAAEIALHFAPALTALHDQRVFILRLKGDES